MAIGAALLALIGAAAYFGMHYRDTCARVDRAAEVIDTNAGISSEVREFFMQRWSEHEERLRSLERERNKGGL